RNGDFIGNYVRENPQFQYGTLSYSKFYEEYVHRGVDQGARKAIYFVLRVVSSIPLATWSFVVKTIYHISLVIFNSVKAIFTKDSRGIKANFYHVIRDFQEGTGRLLSIFSQSLGHYLIQQANFNRICYDCFTTDS